MSERAVSEVVSYVLVFALVVSAVGVVSVSGLSTLQETRNDEQMANAQKAFSVLSDNVADVHRRDAPSRATEISLGEARLETGSNVTMRVSVRNSSDTVLDRSWKIRPIVYTGDEGRKLVYEGGAVFRTSNGGGIQVSDPPFVVNKDSVLISVVGLNRPDSQAYSGSTVLIRTKNQGTSVAYSNTDNDAESVTVELQNTDQPGLWRDYFEGVGFDCQTSGVECSYTPGSGSTIDQTYVVYHDIEVDIES
ncbi:DUF7289 family protein [Haloarcula rara]|uniref:DUF7289 family protein n=1 Tax=Haloarcula rara TaxID=3033387 RepID=UPI0023E8DF72|nr:hypothetical protein [Halomicroarcula sp. SHR3]